MIDLARRGFLFGAAATLAVPPLRTFHFFRPLAPGPSAGSLAPKIVWSTIEPGEFLIPPETQSLLDVILEARRQMDAASAVARQFYMPSAIYEELVAKPMREVVRLTEPELAGRPVKS